MPDVAFEYKRLFNGAKVDGYARELGDLEYGLLKGKIDEEDFRQRRHALEEKYQVVEFMEGVIGGLEGPQSTG